MPERDRESTFDEILDRVMSGKVADIEGVVAAHPELAASEVAELRSMARLFVSKSVHATGDAPMPAREVAGFRIIRRLGAGSAGEVFLARQPGLDRDVALKVLRPGLAFSAEASARFTREAQALARLSHPSIVGIFAFGEDRGVRWIAMEYVEGRSLDEILAERVRSRPEGGFAEILGWARDVASGLGAAHSAGLVHRDVKPSNIKIRADGRAVLLDFGLALAHDASTLTETGAFRGSPRYASPEQVSPSGVGIDARSDVYALGVVLYEAVTGVPPYVADTTESLFSRILAGNALPARRVNPAVPRELETVVMMAMDSDPGLRYPDGAALAADLDALLHIRDIIARPPGLIRRLRKMVRLHPKRAMLAGAILLALVVAGAEALRRSVADRALVGAEMQRAETAASAGEFDTAIAAVDRALGASPKASGVEGRRRELLAARDRARVSAEVNRARERLDAYRAARDRAVKLESDFAQLESEMRRRPLTVEERERQDRGDTGLAVARAEAEESFHAVEQGLAAALALDPDSAAAHATLAELHLERWREAVASDDRESMRRSRAFVEQHDRERRHASELAGLGHVAITASDPRSSIDLFRYVEEGEVVPGGSRRLVPVPFPERETPVPPGTWAIRVVSAAGGLEPDDLILELDGQPVGGRCFVSSAEPPLQKGDALLSVDGETTTEPGLLMCAMNARTPRSHSLGVVREGRALTFEIDDLAALHALLETADHRALSGGMRARIWRSGRVVLADLPPPPAQPGDRRADYRMTATPLFSGPERPAATFDRDLEPGSWMAVVRAPGCLTQRVPFVVPRAGRVTLPVELPRLERALTEFVHVPPGDAAIEVVSHDVESRRSSIRHVAVGGFWILDREVKTWEFLQFLNSPECPESRKTFEAASGAVHGPAIALVWNQLRRTGDGRFEVPRGVRDVPVNGVSADDALAYAAWCTASARAEGHPVTFALPTDVELVRAACGSDGRAYPYGNHFGSAWQKTAACRTFMFTQPGRMFPIDESPFGVFDLLGSESEWCVPTTSIVREHFSIFGGSLQSWSVARLQSLSAFKRDVRSPEFGFRLVVRDP